MSRQWMWVAIGSIFGLAAFAAWWLPSAAVLRPPLDAVDRLVQRCEDEMLRGVCRVQGGPPSSAPQDTVVFVAGVGAIDAASYRSLRDAGEQICSTVRQTCSTAWDGLGCRAARALHGEP